MLQTKKRVEVLLTAVDLQAALHAVVPTTDNRGLRADLQGLINQQFRVLRQFDRSLSKRAG